MVLCSIGSRNNRHLVVVVVVVSSVSVCRWSLCVWEQAYEDSDAQRWAEIDEIKRMVADLNTTVAATAQEWQADRTELANKLAESEGMRKQLQAQIAALEQAAESRARALQQAQSTATVCYVACGGEWSLYLAHQCPTDCSPRTPSRPRIGMHRPRQSDQQTSKPRLRS